MDTLWLALHLPHLSLDIHPPSARGRAVVDNHRVLACDAVADEAGVQLGMKAALARSLLPGIELLPHEPLKEAALLDALACWAGTWTPRICIVPQRGLLLEIGSCLTLFGGFERMHERILDTLGAQGYSAVSAAAPVAQGALWLALAGANGIRTDRRQLPYALDALRLETLATELPADCLKRLGSFGVRTLGEVRHLPQAALMRRIGATAMQEIAKAYGELPDARPEFAFPERFDLSIELPAAVESAEALLFGCRRLVQALAGWLQVRQAGIRECALLLGHTRMAATPLPLHFAELLREPKRIEDVLRERLPRVPLPAPVDTLQLKADIVLALPGQSRPLFRKEGAQSEGMPGLIERLRARLGDAQVHGYALLNEHRPECVSTPAPLGVEAVLPSADASRPLYLLAEPKALVEKDSAPYCNGPLRLLAGPERIESGWWDAGERNSDGRPTGDVRRDYFVALAADQRWLWIYRECRADLAKGGGWFLHGYFS